MTEVDFNEECARWKVVADRLKNYYVPLWGAGFDSSIDEELKRDARELDAVLDECINADLENIDHSEKVWLLLNQGLDSREFDEKLRMYDFSNKCGAVWNTHSVAYRCMTCAKNPCMSLCENCYEEGGHRHHDSTRFFSLAGGACDCGSEDTLEKSGFCRRHGADAVAQAIEPPKDFLSLTEFVVVKLFIKLFLHYRTMIPDIENRYKEDKARMNRELIIRSLSEPCGVTDLLLEMINKGAAPRRSMVRILLDAELYARCHTPDGSSKNGACFHEGSTEDLRLAFETLPTLESVRTCVFRQECELFPSDDFREPSQCLQFDFRTMADELSFWLVRLGFPQPLIDLTLALTSETVYRDIFGHSIIRYYEQSIQHLANLYTLNLCDEANDLIARMIHVSVQICSSEAVSKKLQREANAIHVILNAAIRFFAPHITFKSRVPDGPHFPTVSCEGNYTRHKQSYWSFLNDLQNFLSHDEIGYEFITTRVLVQKYMILLRVFQGANPFERIVTGNHIENDYSPRAQRLFGVEYELESVLLMNLCSAVKNYDHDGAGIQVFMTETIQNLNLFFQCHGLGSRNQLPYDKISFHIPLHRMLSAFLYLGSVGNRHLRLRFEQLDKNFFRQLLIHPLHIMVILNESTTSMWIRNGRPFQAAISFYRHYLFGMSFIDLDLFLIKYAAGVAGPSVTLDSIFAAYHVNELWRQATSFDHSEQYYLDKVWISVMAEAVTTRLIEIVTFSMTSIDREGLRRDVLACLFLGKNAHSAIVEALCDRGQGWLKLISDHLEDVLKEVAEFKTPDSGGEIMSEGSYTLKEECWFEDFDPVYCRIRTFKSAEFGELCLKVEEIDRKRLDSKKKQAAGALWIPFRICSFEFNDEQNVHAVLGAMILCDVKLFDYVGHILHFSGVPSEAEHDQSKMSSLAVQQAIYLLTLSIAFYKSALMAKADLITDDLREQYSRKNLLFELFSHQVRNVTVLDHVLRLYRQQMKDRSKPSDDASMGKSLQEQIDQNPERLLRICGNGIHYIGRLFCLAYRSGDLKLKKAIDKVLECGAASREESPDSETDRTARRLVMKRKQQEIMANLSKKNARLLKQMERQEDANTSGTGMEVDSPESEETEQFCSLCKAAGNYTQGSTNLLGSFAYVAGSPAYMLAMGCEDEELLDEECTGKTRVMYAKQKANMCSEKRILNVLSLHSVIGFPSAEIRSCGHLVHLRCYETYMRDTVEPARQRNSNRFRAGRYQVTLRDNPTAREPCPICRQQYNSFLPIVEPIHGVGLSESHGEERTSGELMASLMRSVKYFEPIRYSSAEKNYFRSLIRLCKEVVITFKLMGSVEASLLAVIENGITLRRFGYKDLNRRALVCGALAPLMATNLKNVDITNTRRFLSTLFYPMFGPRGKNRLRVPTLFFHMKTMFLRGLCFIGTDKSCSRNESVAKVMLLFKHVLYATLTKTIVLYIRGEKVTNVEKLLEEVNLLLGTLKGVPVEVYGNVVAAVLDYERLRSRELPLSVVTEERSHKLYNADELFKILESTTQDLVHFTLSFLHFSNLKHFEHMPSYSLSNDELFELLNGLYLQDFSFEKKFVSDWIGHYLEVPEVGEIDLDVQEPLVWKNRTLIDLDNNFDDIFKYNYNRECLNCDRVSKNPMVCLVCGTLVCIEYVERSRETSELISHVKSCTSGNCCFLSILTSLIVIVQNYEYSIWGSVYLDNHGEEDRQLKRGRPLFLNKNRYRLLQRDWLSQIYTGYFMDFAEMREETRPPQ